jgi:hypothetical protein
MVKSEDFMRKLFVSTILLFLTMNVYAATARITSQYLIQANVFSEMYGYVVNMELDKIKREGYTITLLESDAWNTNNWVRYMARLSIRNRNWYKADIGAIYRTNLVSDSGRRYVVFTCITQGENYVGETELLSEEYVFWGYEIKR